MNHVYRVCFVIVAMIAILFIAFYLLSDVVAPFLAAFVLAYFTEPLVRRMEKVKIKRNIGAIIIICMLALLLIGVSILIFPVVYRQILEFSHIALNNKDKVYVFFNKYFMLFGADSEYVKLFQSHLDEIAYKVLGFSGDAIQQILRSSLGIVNVISFLFITPVMLFYALDNWSKIVDAIHNLIPRAFFKDYKLFITDLDRAMSGYIRGQGIDCIFMMCYYSLAYWMIGLESAFAIGLITGFFTFIPYVGVALASIISISISITQFGSIDMVLIVVAAIVLGNIIEGYIIIPKFVGGNMDVHPAWTIFGLMVGGSLFGFWGMLLALPLTAFTSVVIKFALRSYKVSNIYK